MNRVIKFFITKNLRKKDK